MNGERLAAGEQCFYIDGPRPSMRLFLRRLGATSGPAIGAVLYVHGATFPSGLSVAYRFSGRSWRDALCDAGFNVWGLDFYGFGQSDRYPEMDQPADQHGPLGLAAESAQQLLHAVRFILGHEHRDSLSLISHSWGSMPAGWLVTEHPTLVDRWALFAPIARREAPRYSPAPTAPAWRLVSAEDQWKRFNEDVPPDEPAPMPRRDFDEWASSYLATDPDSGSRTPASVKTPTGPFLEILRAWHGELAYDPSRIQVPIALLRGAWDGLVQDHDAHWLFETFCHVPSKRDIKLGRATHLMHLEVERSALWAESIAFLLGDRLVAGNPSSSSSVEPTLKGSTAMSYEDSPKDIPGYNPGTPEVARSPISLAEWKDLQASAFFSDEDVTYLRLSHEVLKDQAEDLVKVWRGIIALHPHLKAYSQNPQTGEADPEYSARVGKRFAQWVLDTAKAEYDQAWLDYQYEIGLRHHRSKKNQTDHAHTAAHIRGRDVLAFTAATVAPMRPYLEKGGHSPDVVNRMYDAWWKSMILQVTLWLQPYMKDGDF